MGITLFLSALIFLSDFLIKTYLRHNLDPLETIPVIKNILHITLVFNRGAAFGVLQGKTTFLIYAAVIFVFIFLLVMKKEDKKNLTFWIASGLILGGAASNLVDRIFLGAVVDYIDLRIWPVFNLSDSGITVGAGLLILGSFRRDRSKEAKK